MRRNKKKKEKANKKKGRWRRNSFSRSRSPSIIIEGRFSRSVSPLSPPGVATGPKKHRRGRSATPSPPRKKQKEGKASKKTGGLKGVKGNNKRTIAGSGPAKKGKAKKSKRLQDNDIIIEGAVIGSKPGKKKKNRRNAVGGPNLAHLDDDLSLLNTHVSSEIADKEVYASGDKIMVSVNFRSNRNAAAVSPVKKPRPKNMTVTQKPVCVIDIMSSPYKIIEASPKEVVDVFSDDEDKNKKVGANNNNSLRSQQQKTSKQRATQPGPVDNSAPHKTPSPKENSEKLVQQQQQQTQQQQIPVEPIIVGGDLIIHTGHKGPCTPPPMGETMISLTKGPQTPSDLPDDSYDPCNPTESPDISWENPRQNQSDGELNQSSDSSLHNLDFNDAITNNGGKEDQHLNSLLTTAAKVIPMLFGDGIGGIATNGNGQGRATNASTDYGHDNDKMDLPVDMDMDSPTSPQSSDMSDIFEPPLNTPLTNKKLNKNTQRMHKNESSRAIQKKGAKASAGKLVHMKVVDDKLRIIDDVPSSAVEMVVKEKFLRKVQRQERAVEEIKMVLKPFYNRKKIDKDAYKEILRKCVPKVCHSKNGDINPLKIQKLVNGYVKKYNYLKKKGLQRTF